jgi:hypothetical protein
MNLIFLELYNPLQKCTSKMIKFRYDSWFDILLYMLISDKLDLSYIDFKLNI